jgi:hypothetical protein
MTQKSKILHQWICQYFLLHIVFLAWMAPGEDGGEKHGTLTMTLYEQSRGKWKIHGDFFCYFVIVNCHHHFSVYMDKNFSFWKTHLS